MSYYKNQVDAWFGEKKTFDFEEMGSLLSSLADSLCESVKYDIKNELLMSVLSHYEDCIEKIEELDVANNDKLQQVFYLGFLSAIIQTESVKSTNKKKDEKWYDEISSNKHLVSLLSILYKNNALSKETTMANLHLNQSAMTNLYNKTKLMNLFVSKKHGRNVYYYITDEGREYYKFIVAENRNLRDSEKETENVLYLLEKIREEKFKTFPNAKDVVDSLDSYGIRYSKPLTLIANINSILYEDCEVATYKRFSKLEENYMMIKINWEGDYSYERST